MLAGVGAHVVVAGFYPCAVVDDAVEDRVGSWTAVESAGPVLLPVLGAEDGAAGVLAAFHDLVDEPAHGRVGFVDEPFVEDEESAAADLADEFGLGAGFEAGGLPLLGQVGHADVEGAVPVAACLACEGVGDPGLAGACESLDDDVAVLFDPPAGGQFVELLAVEAAFLDELQAPQVGVRVAQFGSAGESVDAGLAEHGVRVVDGDLESFRGAGGLQCGVLAFERVEQFRGVHLAHLAFGLGVDVHRSCSSRSRSQYPAARMYPCSSASFSPGSLMRSSSPSSTMWCIASMFVRQVERCFSAVWADGSSTSHQENASLAPSTAQRRTHNQQQQKRWLSKKTA